MIKIAPSILSADFSDLRSALKWCQSGGADYVHIDVMDNQFVPNLTIGPVVVKSLRPISNLFFDVHLMVINPMDLVEPFYKSGANNITFHVEACQNPSELINTIKSIGCEVGISLKPQTPLETIVPFLNQVDRVLIMSVEPGFGGQTFINASLDKIKQLKILLVQYKLDSVEIEVDGGIKLENAREVARAGADALVVGSGIFQSKDPVNQITQFKHIGIS